MKHAFAHLAPTGLPLRWGLATGQCEADLNGPEIRKQSDSETDEILYTAPPGFGDPCR